MRKLDYLINIEHLRNIKEDIVPALFTEHQFELIEKKAAGREMTNSEKNEFSRSVSRKMKAINSIMEKETGGIFVYGKDKIRKDRLKIAISHIRAFSRKFKNRHVFISGSFLYSGKYNDIDIFVISKYEKEDYHLGEFHINYLTEDVYNSLFFASIRKLCISNKSMDIYDIKEKIDINTFISIYQELFNDLDRKFEGIKIILREFLLQTAYIAKLHIPDSLELRQQIDSILKLKRPKEIIKKIFVNAIIMGINSKEALILMKEMISSYEDIMKEYKQHKDYYIDLMEAFREVIAIES